jgi:hypothetical protein
MKANKTESDRMHRLANFTHRQVAAIANETINPYANGIKVLVPNQSPSHSQRWRHNHRLTVY